MRVSKVLTDASSYNSAGDVIEGLNRHFNYGPANHDRRHIFVGTYTYRLPVLRDHAAIVRSAFGGWELSGIMRLQGGAFLTPTGASNVPGNRRSQYLGGTVALPSDQRGADHWFNTAAFSNAPPTELGNAGVGIIQGPGWENWDIALRKVFQIRERFAMRFTADAFNLMNHVNFDDPNVTTSSSSFGTISAAQPARNIQFGLRLTF